MKRNWGIPSKSGGYLKAHGAKPLMTLGVTAVFGILAAALAAISFSDARTALSGLFRGPSLAAAIVAAGFGCWIYIFLAWQRFAAQFTGGDAFSDLVRFYARAGIGLVLTLLVAKFAGIAVGDLVSGLILCVAGGASAAAAFQTVMTFVPTGATNDAG